MPYSNHLRQGHYVLLAFVCLSVCLFVCLLATSRKTTDRIFMKVSPGIYLWTTKNWLTFSRRPHLNPDVECLNDSSTLRNKEFFLTIWLIPLEQLIGSSWKFYPRRIFVRRAYTNGLTYLLTYLLRTSSVFAVYVYVDVQSSRKALTL